VTRRKKQDRRQVDLLGQLSSAIQASRASEAFPATSPPEAAPAPAEPRLGFLQVEEVPPAFRLSRPICLQIDFAADHLDEVAPSFAAVDAETGERVTALDRREFLWLLGQTPLERP
jgi:hypothetical protein